LYNTYKGWAPLILAGSDPDVPLYSREGTTQGDPMSMAFYAVGVLPLIRALKRDDAIRGVLQVWYADDSSAADNVNKLIEWFQRLIELGPDFGYFPEPQKSVVVVKPTEVEGVQQLMQEAFPVNCPKVTTDQRLLGGHLGDATGKRRYVRDKVEKWVRLINQLAAVAIHHPQAAYTALTRSVQCEWQYLQRTVAGCGLWFAPIEEALTERFLPTLLQVPQISPELRRLYALPVKFGGLGIPDPTRTADAAFATSQAATEHLCDAIRGFVPLRLPDHQAAMRQARSDFKAQKVKACDKELASVLPNLPEDQQRAVERAVKHKTSAWLTAMPSVRNGNKLCAAEWRDGIAFRYGWEPASLQPCCDGCGEPFNADHALKCRKGGLIIRRHNDVCMC
jgi:hypothetical protein